MDTESLVEQLIDDGQRLVNKLVKEGFKVSAACWAKMADNDRISLFVSSPIVDEKGPLAAYRQLQHILRSLEASSITLSDISIISHQHPITTSITNINTHNRLIKKRLVGGMPVDELYIYSLTDVASDAEMAESQESRIVQGTKAQPILPEATENSMEDPDSDPSPDLDDELEDEEESLRSDSNHKKDNK